MSSHLKTMKKGFEAVQRKIERLGGENIQVSKFGNKQFIIFSTNNKEWEIATRSKASGTWQTTIEYGEKCSEDINERQYWVFVDLEIEPSLFYKFYIVPLWWIKNDIYTAHQNYLRLNGGERPKSLNSQHHGIKLNRIEKWKDRWDLLELSN
ncbi:hypothetical protein SPBRAN_1927 [uncultured Candidatus Thioglobus sp.]|nr:hypothetical protein SPBRAN_1927 [uncultured Candidatus Thioglobus sp.]